MAETIGTKDPPQNPSLSAPLPKALDPKRKQSSSYVVRSLLAGGIAGCAAKTVIAPLDRVKILFQTSTPRFEKYTVSHFGVFQAGAEIIESQGWKGLFQGHSATLLRIFPYAAIKFMAYEQIKFLMMPTKKDESHWKKFVAGSLAGCTSVFCSYPLDLLRVRLALEIKANSESGILAACKSIYREPALWSQQSSHPIVGLTNFYKGFMPTIYGMIPYAGVSFLTYESLKTFASTHFTEYTLVHDEHSRPDHPRLRAWAYLSCGALSGALAQTASYPLEVIRRMMQVAGSEALPANIEHRNTLATAKSIWRRKGFRGFYVGLTIGYLKVAPMFGVSFYVYEAMKKQLGIGEL